MVRMITLNTLIEQTYLENIGTDMLSKNKNQITYYLRESRILSRLIKYDREDIDIQSITHQTIFYGLGEYLNDEVRYRFEKSFINKFIYRRFAYQTYEVCNSILCSIVSQYGHLIEEYYNNDFVRNRSNTLSDSNNTSNTKDNTISSTLPQDQINMDLNIDTMEYADTNDIHKSKVSGSSHSDTTNTNSNSDNLEKLYSQIERIFNLIDKRIFTQIG